MIEKKINSTDEMIAFGREMAKDISGGTVIELIGDVGAGKTTFTKGLADGLGVSETVQSPSFTISRVYDGDNFTLSHYDFYRLNDAGIMAIELADTLSNSKNITIVEWAESVEDILPEDRVKIKISNTGENSRKVEVWGIEK